MSRNWKPVELQLAKLLGGERVPVSGRTRGWAPDIAHAWLALEIKSRKRLPIFLANAMDQAQKSAAWIKKRGQGDRLAVAIIHEDGSHYRNSLIVLKLGEFIDNFGDGHLPSSD